MEEFRKKQVENMRYREQIQRLFVFALTISVLLASFCGCGRKEKTVEETPDITMGIDVARYQGTIDWQQVAQSDVDFAIVRVGYRAMADGQIKPDPNGQYNLQEASKAGVSLGAYFFSTAVTEEEAMEEAAWVAEFISGYPITYPVVYDCEGFNAEDSRQYLMTRQERTDVAMVFLKTIESLGYEGMFYGSKNDLEFDNCWETSRIEEEYKIWVAQYPAQPYPATEESSYSGLHHMWQYSTNGQIPGISQPVDLNVAYFGYDGIEKPKSKKTPAEVQPDVEAMMNFEEVSEQVTAKNETALRSIPSQGDDSEVLRILYNGEVAERIAVSSNGWSKVVMEGETYYAVSSYLTTDLSYNADSVTSNQQGDDDGIQTQFTVVNQLVTAKDVVNLRKLPSVEHEDAEVVAQLKNGDTATCVGISDNGWSKLHYKGVICYAVSSYLVEVSVAAAAPEEYEEGIQTQFEAINDLVTAKVEVNLRTLPSVEDPSCVVVTSIKNGDVVTRTGINRDLGWSRVEYNGRTLYCVSSYLTAAE